MYSIDRASTIASRAVASSSTNDERFPIPDSQSNQSIRSASPDACVLFLFPPRVGQADHRSRLITDPPLLPKYQISLSTDDKKHVEQPNRSNAPIERTTAPIERIDRSIASALARASVAS